MTTTRFEYAVRMADGQTRHPYRNEQIIGGPVRAPLYAHKGETWVRRLITEGEWEPHEIVRPSDE